MQQTTVGGNGTVAAKKSVTVYDIAARLGYSPSTVSRVMNNSVLVGTETRKLIREAAEEMGYLPRRVRRPERRSILTVALILPQYHQRSIHLFYDPADLVAGLEAGFGGARANVVISLAGSAARLFDAKKSADLDACVFAFTLPEAGMQETLERMAVPWIVLNRTAAGTNWVAADNAGGMAKLVRAAATRWGHSYRPCFIGFRPVGAVSERRRAGFETAVKECGAADRAMIIELDNIHELSPRRVRALTAKGVNSFHCFNDVMGVYLYQAALQAGVRIPGSASLTGFDSSPVRDLLTRPLDTVNLSVERLGFEASRWLRSVVIERKSEPIHLLVEGEYVPGETVGEPHRRNTR